MSDFSVTITGGTETYLYGDYDDIGSDLNTTNEVSLAADNTYIDVAPFTIPEKLVLGSGTQLVIEDD
jgi:hypothetical protein